MLVRRTEAGALHCVHQEQHALLSGALAACCDANLAGELVSVITLHDNPWRRADAEPRFDAEDGIVDFIGYPQRERLAFYQSGISELEDVDPYVAYMVSLHYTSFAGTRELEQFQTEERTRRERLRPSVHQSDAVLQKHLEWVRFFDILSIHLCLTGPTVDSATVPHWLRDPSDWSSTPDGRTFDIEWRDDNTLSISPWFFVGDQLSFGLKEKPLTRPDSAAQLKRAWKKTPWRVRLLQLKST